MSLPKTPASEIIKKIAPRDQPVSVCTEVANVDPEVDLDYYQLQHMQVQLDTLSHNLQESRDNHKLRMDYANKIFILVCLWLGCVILSVLLAGFKIFNFSLSDKVLITFITSTTINVLGLFAIVAKWLFQQNDNKNKAKDTKPSDKPVKK